MTSQWGVELWVSHVAPPIARCPLPTGRCRRGASVDFLCQCSRPLHLPVFSTSLICRRELSAVALPRRTPPICGMLCSF